MTRASPLSLYWVITTTELRGQAGAELGAEGRQVEELEEVEWDLVSFLHWEWWDLLETGVEVVTVGLSLGRGGGLLLGDFSWESEECLAHFLTLSTDSPLLPGFSFYSIEHVSNWSLRSFSEPDCSSPCPSCRSGGGWRPARSSSHRQTLTGPSWSQSPVTRLLRSRTPHLGLCQRPAGDTWVLHHRTLGRQTRNIKLQNSNKSFFLCVIIVFPIN